MDMHEHNSIAEQASDAATRSAVSVPAPMPDPLRRESAERCEDTPWLTSAPDRVPPRECIRAARDALNRAYSRPEACWPLIAEAVDWQRRALEQMVEPPAGLQATV